MELKAITFKEACAFISEHHHKPGWKFGTSVVVEGKVVGVIMVGRPVSRHMDNGEVLEVIRCCTDGTKHVASKLYAAAWRAARALGYQKLITLESEEGTSLKAAGWERVRLAGGGSWSCPSRAPTCRKVLWQKCSSTQQTCI